MPEERKAFYEKQLEVLRRLTQKKLEFDGLPRRDREDVLFMSIEDLMEGCRG